MHAPDQRPAHPPRRPADPLGAALLTLGLLLTATLSVLVAASVLR